MKKTFLLLSACALFLFACKKDKDNTPVTPAKPYAVNFTFNGTSYKFSGDTETAQYLSSYVNRVGGIMFNDYTPLPSVALSFYFDHHPTNEEVLGLAGQSISFDIDAAPRADVEFSPADPSEYTWYSADTSASVYNIHINSVNFVKVDTTIFNVVDVYQVKGTCNATMVRMGEKAAFTDCSFNMLMSRVKE